jgi:hypothetical protein
MKKKRNSFCCFKKFDSAVVNTAVSFIINYIIILPAFLAEWQKIIVLEFELKKIAAKLSHF